MGVACTYVTSPYTSKSYIFDSESPLLSLWYFSLYHKTNTYTKRMRRLLSVSVIYILGERYISYKVTH